jgi:hypothetical protein
MPNINDDEVPGLLFANFMPLRSLPGSVPISLKWIDYSLTAKEANQETVKVCLHGILSFFFCTVFYRSIFFSLPSFSERILDSLLQNHREGTILSFFFCTVFYRSIFFSLPSFRTQRP